MREAVGIRQVVVAKAASELKCERRLRESGYSMPRNRTPRPKRTHTGRPLFKNGRSLQIECAGRRESVRGDGDGDRRRGDVPRRRNLAADNPALVTAQGAGVESREFLEGGYADLLGLGQGLVERGLYASKGADRQVVHHLPGIVRQELKLLEVGVCAQTRERQKRRCVGCTASA